MSLVPEGMDGKGPEEGQGCHSPLEAYDSAGTSYSDSVISTRVNLETPNDKRGNMNPVGGKVAVAVLAFGLVHCGGVVPEPPGKAAAALSARPWFCDAGVDNVCLVPGWNLGCTDSGPGTTWVAGWQTFQDWCTNGVVRRETFCDNPNAQAIQNACGAFAGACSGDLAWQRGWDWYQRACVSSCNLSLPTAAGKSRLLFAFDRDYQGPSCTTGSQATPLAPSPFGAAATLSPANAYGTPGVVNDGGAHSAYLRYELSKASFKDLSRTSPSDPQGIAHEGHIIDPGTLDDGSNRSAMTVLSFVRISYNTAADWARGKDWLFSTDIVQRDGLWGLSLRDRNAFFFFETEIGGPIWMRSWRLNAQREDYRLPLDTWILVGGRVDCAGHTSTLFTVEAGRLRKFEDEQSGRSGNDYVFVGDRMGKGNPYQTILTLGPGKYDMTSKSDRDQLAAQKAAGVIVNIDDIRYYSSALSDGEILEIAAGLR